MLLSYGDKSDIIDTEITKRKSKWHLDAITWMDFDDVKQLIRIHVHEKWHLWDQSRPIEPWLNKLISHKIINIIRDHYWCHARPCLRCDANQGGELCGIYQTQCEACPLYAKWVKKKKKVHELKMPISYDDRHASVSPSNNKEFFIDYDSSIPRVHDLMKKRLKEDHFKIYEMLYILDMPEEDVAEKLGYKKNKYNKKNRYKQLENYKRKFIQDVRAIIQEGEI